MKKTIIVTGVTGAIGKATAKELNGHDLTLVLAGRDQNKLQALQNELKGGKAEIHLLQLDLGDRDSVNKAISTIHQNYKQVDALLNIAAIFKNERVLNKQKLEAMFATNHLGPLQLTLGILDILKNSPGSKVFTVSAPSTTKIDFENLNGEKKFSSLNAFGASKMMNLMCSFYLSKQFEGSGHSAIVFHPGLVKSELLNEGPKFLSWFLKLVSSTPEKTAKSIAEIVSGRQNDQNGKFYDKNLKALKAAGHAYDSGLQKKLWDLSLNYIQA